MEIIVLDTEMSGSTQEDRVISIAVAEYKNNELTNMKKGLFNPGVPIKQGAYWVHKISNDRVKKKPIFKNTEFFTLLETLFSSQENVIVGHAVYNDLFMLAREGILCKAKIIDTQQCAVKILKTTKTALNFLAKELNLINENEEIKFHTAEGDVCVTFRLFQELLKHNTVAELIEISMEPFYNLSISIDRKKKQTIQAICEKDKNKLLPYFKTVKDPRTFYAMMFFYGNC